MKKNLIYIIGSLQVGGAERHLASLLPRLSARGWSIQVITLIKKGLLAAELEKKGIPVILVLNERYLRWIQRFPRWVGAIIRIVPSVFSLALRFRKEKNTIVHFFLPESYVLGMLGAELAQFSGPKIMSRRSLNFYQRRRPIVKWFEKKLHARTSMIVGNSKAVVSQLQEDEKVPKNHLRLIYNGIDTTAFASTKPKDKVRKELGIENNAFIIIHIANLIPYKAHADLLIALSKIKDRLPLNWRLVCVGRDDGIGSSLQKQTEAFGLKEHVLWMGARRDIPDLLVSADVGVLCSHEEGFSNAILEGMAAGLPMVVTDVGGNKEAVIDNYTGYVVQARDPGGLANAILDLAHHPEKILQFGRSGKLRVEKHFSLEACVEAYEMLYGSLCVE